MSRLGRKPIEIPDKVKVNVAGLVVSAEGPAGKLSITVHSEIDVKIQENKRVVVTTKGTSPQASAIWGTWRSHVSNLIEGVSKGYEKTLNISGVGYNAKLAGEKLTLILGFSHPVEHMVPKGVVVSCPTVTSVLVRGVDKQKVGQFAAEIRASRPAEPYNLKGVKYNDEVIRRKAGKTFVTGAT